MLASYWGHVGVILGSCWGHDGIILGSFWGHIGFILGSFWDHDGIILGSFWGHVGILLGPYWGHVGVILASMLVSTNFTQRVAEQILAPESRSRAISWGKMTRISKSIRSTGLRLQVGGWRQRAKPLRYIQGSRHNLPRSVPRNAADQACRFRHPLIHGQPSN